MKNIQIRLSYWTYPEGDDFEAIEAFKNDLQKDYELTIKSEKTDTLGNGLYEFIIEIITEIKFSDIAKDYIEDGIKFGLALFWKPIFEKIKELFNKNNKFTPDIEVAKFIFNDLEIIIYPTYKDSISEVIDELITAISLNYSFINNKTDLKIKTIHIPIFNKVDTYELCAYRVKLYCDENIEFFSKNDYFKFWGIRCEENVDYIFDFELKSIVKTRFYIQSEYDNLYEQKFNNHIYD